MSRTKGARNVSTIVRMLAKELVTVKDGEVARKVPLVEALLLRLQHLAMKGDIEADKALDRLKAKGNHDPHDQAGVLLVPEPLGEDEWKRRAEILSQLTTEPEMPDGKPSAEVPSSSGPDHKRMSSKARPYIPSTRKPPRLIR